jgi:copper(I)-binding protein
MIIKNRGNEADRMLSADSDVAEAVELHISEMKDGVMTMHQVDGIDVPGNGQAELKPGGLHVMLIGLKQELKAGDIVKLSLNFEKSGTITTEAEVRLP